VSKIENYKIIFGTIIYLIFKKIIDLLVKLGDIHCNIVFFIVNINSYDTLLSLIFLKIRAVVNVEKGIIQMHNGRSMEVKLLPLTIVNMLQVVFEHKFTHTIQQIDEDIQGSLLLI
jgi:hypothetical protein